MVTGETGAGKTILTQAVGLLLGARGDVSFVGRAGEEAYVEAELDLPDGVLDDQELGALGELQPEDDPGLVVARRVFADGRSRAYAWGRAAPRDEVAGAVERLVAMSGQFEQRRLSRAGHQLDLLDAFCGERHVTSRREAALAWRALQEASRRREAAVAHQGDALERRAELEALVAAADGVEPRTEELLRVERDRLRNASGLAEAASGAAEALAPELADADGAADLAAQAGRELAGAAELAPELAAASAEIADAAERLRGIASDLRGFLEALESQPGRLEEVEERLGRLAEAKRRFRAASTPELVERAAAARTELATLGGGADPVAVAKEELAEAEARYEALAASLHESRLAAAGPFGAAAREELVALGLGEGELVVELNEREGGPTGRDEATFLIRPNAGLDLAPIASTASGGELSRIALALRAAAHLRAGEPTIVFDEIDAGIGGQTAHAVAEALRRLAAEAQVVTITHLPQIASVAERHFRVEKIPGDPTHTRIELLDEGERRDELERMLGGAEFLSTLR